MVNCFFSVVMIFLRGGAAVHRLQLNNSFKSLLFCDVFLAVVLGSICFDICDDIEIFLQHEKYKLQPL